MKTDYNIDIQTNVGWKFNFFAMENIQFNQKMIWLEY